MELSQLKVFFEVSEHLNFSKAAKKLHLSQPAVSIRIKSLEKSLKVELFKRSQNKLELTEAGIETKKTCLKIFEEISLLQEKLNEEKHKQEKLNLFFNVNTQENLINKLILIFEDSLKELIKIDYFSCFSEKEIFEKVNNINNSFGIVSSESSGLNTNSIPCFPNEIVLLKKNSTNRSLDFSNLESIKNKKILFPEKNSDEYTIIENRLWIAGYKFEDFDNKKFVSPALINSLTKNSDWLAITTLNIFERENLEGIETIKLDELFIPYTKYLIFNKGNENNNLKNFNKLLELLIELSSKSVEEVQESILRKDIHHHNNLTYKDNFLPFQKIYLNNIDRNNKTNLDVKVGVQHDTIQTSLASIIPEKLCLFDLFLNECNRKENISPKWINHNSAYPIISKLKTEELDFGIVGDYAISHLANQETNSAEDIVLVSFVSINPEGGGSNLILPRDSNVKSLDEFSKGSTIAVPFLSTAYGSLLYNLKSQNLRKEVTLKDYSINNINSIKETNVDAFAFFTPFDYLLESTKDFEILNESISAPISYYGVLVRKAFLQKNEDIVKAFIKSLISAKYWFYSASSTIKKISKWSGVSEKIVNSILGNRVGKDCHYLPDMKIRKDWIDTYTNEIYFEPGTEEFNQTTKKNPIIFEDLLNDAYKELNLK